MVATSFSCYFCSTLAGSEAGRGGGRWSASYPPVTWFTALYLTVLSVKSSLFSFLDTAWYNIFRGHLLFWSLPQYPYDPSLVIISPSFTKLPLPHDPFPMILLDCQWQSPVALRWPGYAVAPRGEHVAYGSQLEPSLGPVYIEVSFFQWVHWGESDCVLCTPTQNIPIHSRKEERQITRRETIEHWQGRT